MDQFNITKVGIENILDTFGFNITRYCITELRSGEWAWRVGREDMFGGAILIKITAGGYMEGLNLSTGYATSITSSEQLLSFIKSCKVNT